MKVLLLSLFVSCLLATSTPKVGGRLPGPIKEGSQVNYFIEKSIALDELGPGWVGDNVTQKGE